MKGLMHIISLFFIFIITPSCLVFCKKSEDFSTKDVSITIFVHGIITIQPFVSLSNIIRFKQDRIAHTLYARAAEYIRKDSFFYQHHAMQGLGLQKINLCIQHPGCAATALGRAFDTISKKSGYAHERNIYYTYGWSGFLSKKMREIEAQIFYTSLVDLLTPYYAQNIFPKVRIIGYSHGACLSIELAAAHYKVNTPIKIVIDELILLGMPIIQLNIANLYDPIFKKVYNIYSEADRVQHIDFFSSSGFFTQRTFQKTSCWPLPEKLTQINYKWYRLAACYEQKWKNSFPDCQLGIKELRPAHPGHIAFWSFGWVPESYRKKLPYYPLPAAAYLPFVIQAAERAPCSEKHIIVEVHPYNESIVVKAKKTINCCKLPFLTLEEQTQLKNDALIYKPINFTAQTFEQHMRCALDKAREQLITERYAKRSIHRSKKSCFDNC